MEREVIDHQQQANAKEIPSIPNQARPLSSKRGHQLPPHLAFLVFLSFAALGLYRSLLSSQKNQAQSATLQQLHVA